jgi:hypothetical protein
MNGLSPLLVTVGSRRAPAGLRAGAGMEDAPHGYRTATFAATYMARAGRVAPRRRRDNAGGEFPGTESFVKVLLLHQS